MALRLLSGCFAGALCLILGGCGEYYPYKPDEGEHLNPTLPYDAPPTDIAEALASFYNGRLQEGYVYFSPDFEFVPYGDLPPVDEIQFQQKRYELLGISEERRLENRLPFETKLIPRIVKKTGTMTDSINMVIGIHWCVSQDGRGLNGLGHDANLIVEYFQSGKNTFLIKKISLVSPHLVIHEGADEYEPWIMDPITRVKEFYLFMEQGEYAKAAAYVNRSARFLEYNRSRILTPCHVLPLKMEITFDKEFTTVNIRPNGCSYKADTFAYFRVYYPEEWEPLILASYHDFINEDEILEIDFMSHGLDIIVNLTSAQIQNIIVAFPAAADSQKTDWYLALSLSRDSTALSFLTQWHDSLKTIGPPSLSQYIHKPDVWGRYPPIYTYRENQGSTPWVLAVGNYFTAALKDLILYQSNDTTRTENAIVIPNIMNARSQVSFFTVLSDTLHLSVHQDSGCIAYSHWQCYKNVPETTLTYMLPLDSFKKDSDADSLSDLVEERLYLNPYERDTDHDGLDDSHDCSPQIPFPIQPDDTTDILQTAFDFIVHLESRYPGRSNISNSPLTLYSDRKSYSGYPGWLLSLDSAQWVDFNNKVGSGYEYMITLYSTIKALNSDRSIVEYHVNNEGWKWDTYTVFLVKISRQWFVVYYDLSGFVQ